MYPVPDVETIKDAYTVKRRRKINSPSPLYHIEEMDIHPINSRIPASQIKHKGNFDAGYKYGGPYWTEGEYYRKQKDYVTALYFYDQARAEGYMAPALYKSYIQVYNQLKDYENTIDIMDEAVILLNRELSMNDSFFEEYNEKRQQACERLKKQREKEGK